MLLGLKMIPNLFNPSYWRKIFTEIVLVWKLMGDSRVSKVHKLIPLLVALYMVSPLDLIPGFIPVIGQLDDFGLLLVGLSTFIRLVPDEVVADYKPDDVTLQGNGS